MASTTNAVSRTLLKSLLRSARKLDRAVPAASIPTELASFLKAVPAAPAAAASVSSFSEAVKVGFRANKELKAGSKEHSVAVDGAFSFLQAANKRSAALAAPPAAAAPALPPKPSEVAFSVGQVFRHRVYGYRAVVIGWDATCKASSEWVASTGTARLPNGTNQPFYHCLVDLRDRPEAQVSYVAQDCFEPIAANDDNEAASASAAVVLHPLAAKYFSAFNARDGCFTPNAALQSLYPHDDATKVPITAAAVAAVSKASAAAVRMAAAPVVVMTAAATMAPSAVRGSVSDNDLILRAALRLKAYRAAAEASSAASVSSAASSSSSSDEEEEEAMA